MLAIYKTVKNILLQYNRRESDKGVFAFLLPWKRMRSGEGQEHLLNNSDFFFKVLDNGVLCLLFPDEFAMRRKECNCMPL